jgi:NAD(P)-dependent dehydrogenase (short-subunit alcohol dehydrogenase family)
MKLKDKVAIVTGGADGIGEAYCRGFANEGAKIEADRRCLKRDEYPDDLIGTAIFLSSSDSDFVTGQTIVVDGGEVMLWKPIKWGG